jgi:UDPglucose 6-dehydrogenase
MNVTVIGCGYVGLVTAAGLADLGHQVAGIDKDPQKITMLSQGKLPIYEDGLAEVVKRNLANGRLRFSQNIQDFAEASEIIFIAVGTPSAEHGKADLSQVKDAAESVAPFIRDYKVIVDKSTVPVGTSRWVHEIVRTKLPYPIHFDVVSNPEFLREGTALQDFMVPDRIVIGTNSPRAQQLMDRLYQSFSKKSIPFVYTDPETAELIKYASNGLLATKIAFINEMSNLCEATGGNIIALAHGVGLDRRIGPAFLTAGPGYGGSCFPKDTKALIQIAEDHGMETIIINAVVKANEAHKKRMAGKILDIISPPQDKTIAVLGLAFKANTNDIRESPSIAIIQELLTHGLQVRVFDPEAMEESRLVLGSSVEYCQNAFEAGTNADAIIIATEWEQFRGIDLAQLKAVMKTAVLIDLRNLIDPERVMEAGFLHVGVGRGDRHNKE